MRNMDGWPITVPARGGWLWTKAWDGLARQVDREYECPDTGEVWQLMCVCHGPGLGLDVAQFRHRSYHGARTVVDVEVPHE